MDERGNADKEVTDSEEDNIVNYNYGRYLLAKEIKSNELNERGDADKEVNDSKEVITLIVLE